MADFWGDVLYDTFWPEPPPVENMARHESGQRNYLNHEAALLAKENGTTECDELKKMLKDAKDCDRRLQDKQYIDDIIQAMKAAGCKHSTAKK